MNTRSQFTVVNGSNIVCCFEGHDGMQVHEAKTCEKVEEQTRHLTCEIQVAQYVSQKV